MNTLKDIINKEILDALDMSGDLFCPFCADTGFDRIGLKYHYAMGYCPVWNATKDIG